MKIAFLSRFQNKINRGAEVFVHELSERLKKNNEVVVFSGKDADKIRNITNGGFDIVVSVNGGMQAIKASLFKKIGKYKLITVGQGGIGRGNIINIAVVLPDVFVALTEKMEKWARKYAWKTKVVKIPNGVDLEKYKPVGKKIDLGLQKPVTLSVGELVWYKHHERAIKAVAQIPNASLIIVGKGKMEGKLLKLGKKLLGKRFKISSFPHSDMPKVYRSADIFTLPSWDREAFGNVYIEAMACGVGVVAPDDDSRKEIVGEGGILVDIKKTDKYAKALQKALTIKWTHVARTQAEKFSWDFVASEYQKVINELVSKKI